MDERLRPFDLERWLRLNEPRARFPIGGSGVPHAPLSLVAPESPAGWDRLWSVPGDAPMRASVSNAYGVPEEEILLTQGASEADFLAYLALAGPGSHAVVEEPAYFSLVAPARALGVRTTRVRRRAERGHRLDPAEVIAALTPRTVLVVLARPHNPTGDFMPDRDLVEIADAAARVGAVVLVDEVFAEATPAGDRPARLLHPSILTASSVTKCYGFGNLHVGWLLAPADLLPVLDRAKAHVSVVNPRLDLHLAALVLDRRKKILEGTRERRAANAEVVRRFLGDVKGLVSGFVPEHGTVTVFDAGRDDLEFAGRILERDGVLLAPGSHIEMPGRLRVGLVGPTETLEAGLSLVRDRLA